MRWAWAMLLVGCGSSVPNIPPAERVRLGLEAARLACGELGDGAPADVREACGQMFPVRGDGMDGGE
jgi:predicted component of type VI protein secretion system